VVYLDVFIIFCVYLSIGDDMAEGTATVQKMNPKEAAKNLATVLGVIKEGKINDIVISIPVDAGVYLTITIPKTAVEEKLKSITLSGGEKAGELTKWLKESVDSALKEYKKQPQKGKFTFSIVEKKISEIPPPKPAQPKVQPKELTTPPVTEKQVKGLRPSLIEEGEEKKKEATQTKYIILYSESAEKEAEKTEPKIISVSTYSNLSKIAGCNITIKLNVTKEDLKVDDNTFKKKIQEFTKMAVENAKKQELAPLYKVGSQTIRLQDVFQVAITQALGDERRKLLESKSTQTIKQ